jgi:hypothetical protein
LSGELDTTTADGVLRNAHPRRGRSGTSPGAACSRVSAIDERCRRQRPHITSGVPSQTGECPNESRLGTARANSVGRGSSDRVARALGRSGFFAVEPTQPPRSLPRAP